MKVLFLTIGRFEGIEIHDMYSDLLRVFRDNGHEVYIVCSNEKRIGKPTELIDDNGAHILRVRIGNITQSGLVEKGISTLMVNGQYKAAIKKYFHSVKFDLVLYTTPPITLEGTIGALKKRDKAFTYLILKDIFPQNAVDIGLLTKTGIKGLIYRHFRKQEKKLYGISDMIGTMSPANSAYVMDHNPEIDKNHVEICPNCIDPRPVEISENEKNELRNKYGIPLDKKVYVYGGNLGKPQDIPFVIECIRKASVAADSFFWVIGSGTDYSLLEKFEKEEKPANFKLNSKLPKEDYDALIASCDVGLLFLDHRFTIPNFPSRLLSYMQAGLPVLACTDCNTDIKDVVVDNGFGWWCESNDAEGFAKLISSIDDEQIKTASVKSRECLGDYSVDNCYKTIISSYNKRLDH